MNGIVLQIDPGTQLQAVYECDHSLVQSIKFTFNKPIRLRAERYAILMKLTEVGGNAGGSISTDLEFDQGFPFSRGVAETIANQIAQRFRFETDSYKILHGALIHQATSAELAELTAAAATGAPTAPSAQAPLPMGASSRSISLRPNSSSRSNSVSESSRSESPAGVTPPAVEIAGVQDLFEKITFRIEDGRLTPGSNLHLEGFAQPPATIGPNSTCEISDGVIVPTTSGGNVHYDFSANVDIEGTFLDSNLKLGSLNLHVSSGSTLSAHNLHITKSHDVAALDLSDGTLEIGMANGNFRLPDSDVSFGEEATLKITHFHNDANNLDLEADLSTKIDHGSIYLGSSKIYISDGEGNGHLSCSEQGGVIQRLSGVLDDVNFKIGPSHIDLRQLGAVDTTDGGSFVGHNINFDARNGRIQLSGQFDSLRLPIERGTLEMGSTGILSLDSGCLLEFADVSLDHESVSGKLSMDINARKGILNLGDNNSMELGPGKISGDDLLLQSQSGTNPLSGTLDTVNFQLTKAVIGSIAVSSGTMTFNPLIIPPKKGDHPSGSVLDMKGAVVGSLSFGGSDCSIVPNPITLHSVFSPTTIAHHIDNIAITTALKSSLLQGPRDNPPPKWYENYKRGDRFPAQEPELLLTCSDFDLQTDYQGKPRSMAGTLNLSVSKPGSVTVETRVDNTMPDENDILRLSLAIDPSTHIQGGFETIPGKGLVWSVNDGQIVFVLANRSIDAAEDFKCEVACSSGNTIGVYWNDDEGIGVHMHPKTLTLTDGHLGIQSDAVNFGKDLSIYTRSGGSVLGEIGLGIVRYAILEPIVISISTATGHPETTSDAEDDVGTQIAAQKLGDLSLKMGN